MKNIIFSIVFFMLFSSETKAVVLIDSVKSITSTSALVYINWNFNTPDTTGYVGLELSASASFSSLISGACPALAYQNLDTGHLICSFTGLNPNTTYYVRGTELTPPLTQWRGASTSFPTAQVYSATQIVCDSFTKTNSGITVYFRAKAGNDTMRLNFSFAKNNLTSGPFYMVPSQYYGTANTNGWINFNFTVAGLDDTAFHVWSVTATNRVGSASCGGSGYTLKTPSAPTPYAITDSAGSIGFFSCILYAHGWTTPTEAYGFKIYPSQLDANMDANSMNIWGVGGVSNFNGAVNLSATPGVTRWYCAYVVYNGATYRGAIKQFTFNQYPDAIVIPSEQITSSTTVKGILRIDSKGIFVKAYLKYNGNPDIFLGEGTYDGSQSIPFDLVDLTSAKINSYSIGIMNPSGQIKWYPFSINMGEFQYIPFYGKLSNIYIDDNPITITSTNIDSLSFEFELKGTCESVWADLQEKDNPGVIKNSKTQLSKFVSPPTGGFVYKEFDFYGIKLNIDSIVYEIRLGAMCGEKINYTQWQKVDLRILSSINEATNTKVNIYPNPVMDKLNIKLESAEEISLIDINGQVLAKDKGKEISFDTSIYPSGVYYIKGDNFTKKIVKE